MIAVFCFNLVTPSTKPALRLKRHDPVGASPHFAVANHPNTHKSLYSSRNRLLRLLETSGAALLNTTVTLSLTPRTVTIKITLNFRVNATLTAMPIVPSILHMYPRIELCPTGCNNITPSQTTYPMSPSASELNPGRAEPYRRP